MSSVENNRAMAMAMAMAREAQMAVFEEVMRTLSPAIPLIVNIAISGPSAGDMRVVSPLTGEVMVIENLLNLEEILAGELWSDKAGPLPASKAAIEALPVVKTTAEAEAEEECAICLGEYVVGGEAKEMPCKHRFHSGCIDKWLAIHGSCPVCRYKLPSEEDEPATNSDSDSVSDWGSGWWDHHF